MALKLGLDMKLYHGTAGATATTEMSNVKDLTLTLTKGEADVTTRAANGWKLSVGTLKEGEISWDMVWDTSDAGFIAIKNAFMNNTVIALAALDGPQGSGLDADCSITSFTRNENLEEAVTVSIVAKPTYSTRAPSFKDATVTP